MPDPDIQLVVFDLGGVMIRLCDSWEHACELVRVTPAHPLTDDRLEKLIELIHAEEVGQLAEGEFFNRAAPLLSVTPTQLRAIWDAWLQGPFDGLDPILSTLHDKQVMTACLSNTNANHWRAMSDPDHPNGLPLDRLNYRFASHLVRERKPNPGIYEHVETITGVPPNAILFFDDTKPNIVAAEQRGWNACLIENPKDPIPQVTALLEAHNLLG